MSSIFQNTRKFFAGMFRPRKEATIKSKLNKTTGPVSTTHKKSRSTISIPERRGSGVPMNKHKTRVAAYTTQGRTGRKKPLRYQKPSLTQK